MWLCRRCREVRTKHQMHARSPHIETPTPKTAWVPAPLPPPSKAAELRVGAVMGPCCLGQATGVCREGSSVTLYPSYLSSIHKPSLRTSCTTLIMTPPLLTPPFPCPPLPPSRPPDPPLFLRMSSDLFGSADAAGGERADQHLRGHARAVPRPASPVRDGQVPALRQLHVPRRLRRQGQAVHRDHEPAHVLQDQVRAVGTREGGSMGFGGARGGVLEACPYAPSLCVSVCRYPESFFLLRGNHECASLNRIYGTLALPTQQYTCPVPHRSHACCTKLHPTTGYTTWTNRMPYPWPNRSCIPASSLVKLVWPSLLVLALADPPPPTPPSPYPSFFLVCRLL